MGSSETHDVHSRKLMAFVPGYKHDVFVSYASVDDQPLHGAKEGWVTTLIKDLRVFLNQRLGSPEAYSLWSAHQLPGHVQKTLEITNTLRNTATFIVILSPGYLNSPWCQREKSDFLGMVKNRVRAGSRVFVVERDRLEPEERPQEFADIGGYQFWVIDREGKPPHVLGTPEPRPEEKLYYDRLNDLSYDLENELRRLKENEEAGKSITPSGTPSVFLAEVTYDLESLRDQIKRSLEQMNIRVLPESYYPRTPEMFKEAMCRDLHQSNVFVQLLSAQPEKKPPDLPQGYVRCQYEIALETGTPILQWRSPMLELASVHDPDLRVLLQGEHVVAMRLEELKTEILNRLSPQKSSSDLPDSLKKFLKWVFVNAHLDDDSLAKEICQRLVNTFGVGYLERLRSDDPEQNREIFQQSVLNCHALMVVYGKTEVKWVCNQVFEICKIASQRPQDNPLTAFGVYDGPPEQKLPLPFHFPGLQVIPCRNCLDEQELGKFLKSLQTGAK